MQIISWVARAPLAQLLQAQLSRPGAPSQRELARRAGVDPRMLRKILQGQCSGWVRSDTADALLEAAGGDPHELERVVAA